MLTGEVKTLTHSEWRRFDIEPVDEGEEDPIVVWFCSDLPLFVAVEIGPGLREQDEDVVSVELGQTSTCCFELVEFIYPGGVGAAYNRCRGCKRTTNHVESELLGTYGVSGRHPGFRADNLAVHCYVARAIDSCLVCDALESEILASKITEDVSELLALSHELLGLA